MAYSNNGQTSEHAQKQSHLRFSLLSFVHCRCARYQTEGARINGNWISNVSSKGKQKANIFKAGKTGKLLQELRICNLFTV